MLINELEAAIDKPNETNEIVETPANPRPSETNNESHEDTDAGVENEGKTETKSPIEQGNVMCH